MFPELEITLMDTANEPVAQRRLRPEEYLRDGADTQAGLAADVYLPVLLELGDPGDRAVGFRNPVSLIPAQIQIHAPEPIRKYGGLNAEVKKSLHRTII